MSNLLATIISISPWILGSYCLGSLAVLKQYPSELRVIFAAVGGLVGYLVIAVLIKADQALIYPILESTSWPVFAFWTSLPVIVHVAIIFFKSHTFSTLDKRSLALVLATAVYSLWMVYCHALLPTQGWDALGHWTDSPIALIEHVRDGNPIDELEIWKKHPLTGVFIVAWTGHSRLAAAGSWVFAPWLTVHLSIVLILAFTSFYFSRSKSIAFVIGYLTTSTPLLENHALLGGYIEILVTAFLVGSISMILIGLESKTKLGIFIGILLAIIPSFLKNIGPMYSLLPLGALATVSLLDYFKERPHLFHFFLSILILFIICILYFALNHGFKTTFLGSELGFEPNVWRPIFLFGRRMSFSEISPELFSVIWFYSLIVNLSFSIIWLLFLFSLFMKSEGSQERKSAVWFMTIVIAFGFILLSLSLLLDAGLIHAIPGQDTGHSRFLIPISTMILFIPALVLRGRYIFPQ